MDGEGKVGTDDSFLEDERCVTRLHVAGLLVIVPESDVHRNHN